MIRMGNDEFILYIRKQYECRENNKELGKKIWSIILQLDLDARQVMEDEPCCWGDEQPNGLPKTATQFEFNREILPALFTRLDEIGRGLE